MDPESGKILLMESGIQLKESGIPLTIVIQNPSSTEKYWNPVPGIQNPQRGIQNPRLSEIPLHRMMNQSRSAINSHRGIVIFVIILSLVAIIIIIIIIVNTIDDFHCDVIKLYSQNSEILRILIYTRLKVNKK